MSSRILKMGLAMTAILMATVPRPRSTGEILASLKGKGLEVTGPELHPWLRSLTEEGLLSPSLRLDASGAQERHYWITREGAKVLESLLPVLRALVAGEPRI